MNLYMWQWKEVQTRFEELANVQTREVGSALAQYNPARMVSTGAKIDKASLAKRPCFLCAKNRPSVQIGLPFHHDFDILVNPFPILPVHFTIPACKHQAQSIATLVMVSLESEAARWIIRGNKPTTVNTHLPTRTQRMMKKTLML